MRSLKPAKLRDVLAIFETEMSRLHPEHRRLIESLRITPRLIGVLRYPGESVWAVAEHEGKVLYWSDIEEGWELELPDSQGAIYDRGCSQFELGHIAYQVFGEPAI